MQKYQHGMAILCKRDKVNVFITMAANQDIQATKKCRAIRSTQAIDALKINSFQFDDHCVEHHLPFLKWERNGDCPHNPYRLGGLLVDQMRRQPMP